MNSKKIFDAKEFLKLAESLDNNANYKKFANAVQPNSGDDFKKISEEGLDALDSNIETLVSCCK